MRRLTVQLLAEFPLGRVELDAPRQHARLLSVVRQRHLELGVAGMSSSQRDTTFT